MMTPQQATVWLCHHLFYQAQGSDPLTVSSFFLRQAMLQRTTLSICILGYMQHVCSLRNNMCFSKATSQTHGNSSDLN